MMSWIPYMQPNMHCKVEGKLFAAVIERQKIDISLALSAWFPGITLNSGATFSAPAVPAKIIIMYQTCTGDNRQTQKLWKQM